MYIVAYTTKDLMKDYWYTYENFEDAKRHYDDCLQEQNIWTASLCKPIMSTDFEVTA
jgi:hypothetical protein